MRASKRVRHLLATVAVILGVGASPALAQDYGVISGTVRSVEGGAPLAGVSVELAEAGRTALSDETGRFLFNRVPAGTHTLRFHVIGRSVLEHTVDVRGDAVARPEIALDAAPRSEERRVGTECSRRRATCYT